MNLVNELQSSAEQDDVLTVLRKTKRLASKLDRQDISDWLHCEQSGYKNKNVSLPDYRKINTTLAINTNGYIPTSFGMVVNGIQDIPSCGLDLPCNLGDSISAVLSMIEEIKNEKQMYRPIEEGTEFSRSLREFIKIDPMFSRQVTFLLHLNAAQVKAIPDQIKDKVLEWACALEVAGVTGEGMSFSEKEKHTAHNVNFNIFDSHIEQLNNSGTNQRGG